VNLRDLWDNVVLRDILGYIVPGLVTLFAVALLVEGVTNWTLSDMVSLAARYAGLAFLDAEPWRPWQPWVAATLVLPLSYAIGHLQVSVADYVEKPARPWYTGSIALDHLKDNRLRLEYYSAAVKILPAVRSQDLRRALANGADDCSQCRNGDAAQDPRQTPLEGADDCRRCRTADAAKHLFLLCDRYVLHKDRDLHSIFMGRYYILGAFFTNLGVSSVLLGFSALVLLVRSCQISSLRLETVFVLGVSLLALTSVWFRKGRADCARGAQSGAGFRTLLLTGLGLVLLLLILRYLEIDAKEVFADALVLVVGPVGFGLALMWRSLYFRKRFVECTFPIFYAIVQEEERSGRLRR